MSNIENWAREYSKEKGMTYEEIVELSLEFYKENVENNMIENYTLGKEFIKLFGKAIEVYGRKYNEAQKANPKVTPKVTPKDKQLEEPQEANTNKSLKSGCEVLEKVDEKEKYLKSIPNLNSDLMNVILSDKTYVLRMVHDGKNYGSALISIEESKRKVPIYTFIHYIDFVDNKYKKLYSDMENEIIVISKKYEVNNVDRIIDGKYMEQFRSLGYSELYKNYNVKFNIENKIRGVNEYEKNLKGHVSSKFVPMFKMVPERFKEKSDVGDLYKFSTNNGKFYAKINIKNEKCYLKLYLEEDRQQSIMYIKNVYYTILNDLYKNGVKIVYTLVGQKHINILKTLGDVNILKEWIWVRRSLGLVN